MARSLNDGRGLSPQTARELLVPEAASDVPAAVEAANLTALNAVEAFERATEALSKARLAAREAPQLDARAAADAHREGKAPPAPTEQTALQAERAAVTTQKLCRAEANVALCRLHDQIAESSRPWIDAQIKATDEQIATVAATVAELDQQFDKLAELAGVERGLAIFNPKAESVHDRCLTRRPAIGQAFERQLPGGGVERRGQPVQPSPAKLLEALNAAAAEHRSARGRTYLEGPEPLSEEEQARRTYSWSTPTASSRTRGSDCSVPTRPRTTGSPSTRSPSARATCTAGSTSCSTSTGCR